MPGEKILVVDDEEDILELVKYNLKMDGFDVICVLTGEKALEKSRKQAIDLIILDLMLPGIDGLEVARQLNADPHSCSIPIIMLSAKGEEADIVIGLELGADDYITKPFSPRILQARVRAVLRRQKKSTVDETGPIAIFDLIINPGKRKVEADGKKVELTFTEFQVLSFLARRPGWVFTRNQIVDAVKGEEYNVTDRSVDVQIVGLRKKLGDCGKYIETVRGLGYRFKEKV
ncbi:ArsR family transcriptional regulator [Candidatus Magnetomorum sp. HK-1]|nr:ArsR family transcriptional regulator [Candidatus Magnetomorum sp. HK-1]